MPDAGQLVRVFDISVPATTEGMARAPMVVFEDEAVEVKTVPVTHGRAAPAFGYRFDTAHGSVVFSGDTTVNDDLIALTQGADILVHCVADLGYLERHGITGAALERMAALHTDVSEVGGVAERAGVRESSTITFPLNRTRSPIENGKHVPDTASAERPPQAATVCAGHSLALVRDSLASALHRFNTSPVVPTGGSATATTGVATQHASRWGRPQVRAR
jgi:hypothetical protein